MKKQIVRLAGLLTLCTSPAFAEPTYVPVSFAGLDLNSATGQAALNRRISNAVRTICGQPDPRDLSAVMASRQCTKATMARTGPSVAMATAVQRRSYQVAAAR